MFTIGGTGILVHKYLGTNNQGLKLTTNTSQSSAGTVLGFATTSSISIGDLVTGTGIPSNTTVVAKDATTITLSSDTTIAIGLGASIGFSDNPAKPSYINDSATNIQDLLFVENRDRKYDTSVYKMRGIYQVADQDFDLSQFGLFLATGTLFMTFHINDMIDILGRRIMAGDVLELQHLIDYNGLNEDLPVALKRYFVVSDCSRATEGYSPTWWPHLWRVKLNPLVDSQEYKDILNNIKVDTNGDGVEDTAIGSLFSNLDTLLKINDGVIAEAEGEVPKSGYDTSSFYIKPLDADGNIIENANRSADTVSVDGSDVIDTADEGVFSPTATVQGYLTGDGLAPNGLPVRAGITFPSDANIGDYVLRTDYLPSRLFRFDGKRWVKIEDAQRTGITQGQGNQTQLGTFVNNSATYVDSKGNTHNQKQSLSKALTPKADN